MAKTRKYEVDLKATLELSAVFEVSATSEDEAEKKAREMVERIVLKWEVGGPKELTALEWEEDSQEGEVENVNEL